MDILNDYVQQDDYKKIQEDHDLIELISYYDYRYAAALKDM